jgi:predicted DNA-binding protein (MmcQ/YjbR family)
MFCAANINSFESINVKCLPEQAHLLREQYDEVTPCRYMNTRYWNCIMLNGKVSRKLLEAWISDSYQLVVNGLPKSTRLAL